jgi:hypothetical protein
LQLKLNELIKNQVIDFWLYIEHLPEDDETKKHKHLYIIPSGLTECSSVLDFLKELDSTMPLDKPLGCILPRSSKFYDFYFYGLHDTAYLLSKGQTRKYHYTSNEYRTSESDSFSELVHQMDLSKISRFDKIRDCAERGIPFAELVANGQIPIQLINQYNTAYMMMNTALTYRANKQGHEFDVDGVLITDSKFNDKVLNALNSSNEHIKKTAPTLISQGNLFDGESPFKK